MKLSSTELWARQLEGDVRIQEPLAQWTSIRVGGPAEILLRPLKLDHLVNALKIARHDGVPIAVLGGGANTLVGDEGVPGLTIKLSPDLFAEEILREGEEAVLSLGAGAAIVRLINQMKAHRLVGAEFLAGIPGTLGGAVTMNAGTKHGECMSVVRAVEVATPEGIGWIPRERLNVRYRRTDLPEGGVVTRVRFALREGDVDASRAAMDADLDYRKRTQPLSQPNFGSVFKNPPGDFAGRLIESVELKGHRIGQAQLSPLHANWIVNLGGATARDVVGLISLAQQRVREATGVELQPEVKKVGEVRVIGREELKGKRIGLLQGGLSVEREVSFKTGAAVSAALRSLGYQVVEIDAQKDLPARLLAEKIDVAFIALHGRYGEDGCVQGLLESMFIPYTGSGVLASSVAMEKVFAKQIFLGHGIPTPLYQSFTAKEAALAAADSLGFPFPVVVKPSSEGSSVGVHVCKTRDQYQAAVEDAAKYAGTIMVEQFIKGREVQGAVLDDQSLGAIEVVPAREFYDYVAKYTPGSGTKYLYPAPLPEDQYRRVNEICLGAHRALGCRGASRSDAIVTEKGEVFILELNTLPGMTATSLLPKIAAGLGIDFPALCERLLLGASLKA